MMTRVDSMFHFLGVGEQDCALGLRLASAAGARSRGDAQAGEDDTMARLVRLNPEMTHVRDYEALAAALLHGRPALIFEIGTYLGITSDFFLQVLPDCRVVSIAYSNPILRVFGRKYNNSELSRKEIGIGVDASRRSRFRQLYGDSHGLDPARLVREHGKFDVVLIDGDHSRDGVAQDTELARAILSDTGAICWHDANPKPKYRDVRAYLEEMPRRAVATRDDYIGGIACWSREIERKLEGAGEALA